MLGGIIFIFVVWFIPLIIWLIKNPFKQKATCEAGKKEILRDKRMFIYVTIFGLFCILATILLG